MGELHGRDGQAYHSVLRFRAENPTLRSEEMAEGLTGLLGKPVSASWVRQTLHRAREKFASCLVDEVRQTLSEPSPENIQQELGELGLLEYCRSVLDGPRNSA
jgi:hypothetical protein